MSEAAKAAGNLPGCRRSRIGGFVASLTKFGLDSAIGDSPKTSTGLRRVYEIVQERLRDHSPASPSLKEQTELKDVAAMLEERQMKMEAAEQKSKEGMARQSGEKTSSAIRVESGVVKKAPEDKYPVKNSAAAGTGKKMIFIRSRL